MVDSSGGVGGAGGSAGGSNGSSGGSKSGSSSSSGDSGKSGGSASAGRSEGNSASSQGSNSKSSSQGSFNDAMSSASKNSDNDRGKSTSTSGSQDKGAAAAAASGAAHANEFSGLGPSNSSVSTEHANEFSGISSSGAPTSQEHASEFSGLGPSAAPTGNESLNSHRGYGPDNTASQGQPAGNKKDASDLVGPAGYVAAAGQGAFQGYGNFADYSGRQAAAGTLTNGPAGNLPAQGYANRAALGEAIAESKNARAALDVTPYGSNARSTQQLSRAAQVTGAVGRVANGVALGLQPAAGAIEGYLQTPKDASWTETVTNSLVGAVKEVDDTAVSFGTGLAVTTVTAPVSGPGSIVAGVGAGAGAGYAYNDTLVDRTIDMLAEDYARPAIRGTLDFVDRGVDGIIDFFSGDDDKASDAPGR